MNEDEDSCPYSAVKTLQTPAHVSSLALGHAGHLFAGSDDGTLRIYDLSSSKVLKAIRGLNHEVSSIACLKRPGSELRDVWVACNRQVLLFKMDTPAMILTAIDALSTIQLCDEDDDVLNEIALDPSKKYLAFSTDSGTVGVVNLGDLSISKMKTKHENVCACVRFIPDRPREIVSAGYDESILHFDFMQETLLSRVKMPSLVSFGGMALSPPFIMSTAMSPSGALAAGTADGRVWVGFAGEKRAKSKRSRKWNGLDNQGVLCQKVAEGPIVALSFVDSETLTASTLLGVIMQWRFMRNGSDGNVVAMKALWKREAKGVEKVNVLITNDTRVIIGGFAKDGKGVIELWDKTSAVPA